MIMHLRTIPPALLVAFAVTYSAAGGDSDDGKLAISIDAQPPRIFGSADIQRLPHSAVIVKLEGGKKRKYTGVPLYDLLDAAGMELGGQQRPAALTSYLVVESGDGFHVLLSGAEIHRFIGATDALLADAEDGQALNSTEGPYRLVVASDKVHARWIRQVKSMHVVQEAAPVNSSK
jgi:hypothetical protein